MLHTSVREPAGNPVTGSSSPSPAPTLTTQQALRRQQQFQADQATIAAMQQRCRAARDLLAAATESLVGSQHFLATSRASLGCDAEEHQP